VPPPTSATSPTVLVVLVAHDGAAWLPRALDGLAAQTQAGLEILAVDNASQDGSRELLLERLGEQQVLVADRDLGFGGAVSMALDARPAAEAPYVLTVHDDLELAPDAVAELVAAMEADPRLAVVGPKLLDWVNPDELQSVGFTIDTTGRSLHRRGYRTHVTAAPLKETLAAAMVMLSYWKRDRPLVDPFCGSGTILIEAAMIGSTISPGILT
jgi:GT2 family glycosyltransferase